MAQSRNVDRVAGGQRWTADIELKKAELQQAQAHLDELLAGSRPQEIQQAQAAVADAQAQHDQARLDWDRAQTLFKNDDISQVAVRSVSDPLRQHARRC